MKTRVKTNIYLQISPIFPSWCLSDTTHLHCLVFPTDFYPCLCYAFCISPLVFLITHPIAPFYFHPLSLLGAFLSRKCERQWKCWPLSPVWLFAVLWTVDRQAPLSMELTRQEYWSGLPFPSPGDLPNPGIEPGLTALQADSLPPEPPMKVEKTHM